MKNSALCHKVITRRWDLDEDTLRSLIKLLRERRDRASDIARRQRREMRGKAQPTGSRPATDDSGTRIKRQILAGALKRANKERQRRRYQAARRTGRLRAASTGDEAVQRRQDPATSSRGHTRGNARHSKRSRSISSDRWKLAAFRSSSGTRKRAATPNSPDGLVRRPAARAPLLGRTSAKKDNASASERPCPSHSSPSTSRIEYRPEGGRRTKGRRGRRPWRRRRATRRGESTPNARHRRRRSPCARPRRRRRAPWRSRSSLQPLGMAVPHPDRRFIESNSSLQPPPGQAPAPTRMARQPCDDGASRRLQCRTPARESPRHGVLGRAAR